MELRQLTTFRTLARRLSFSRTADALNYAQSTVSAQIQALEEELGVVLFDRLGKRVRLTEAGLRLLDYAERIIDLTMEARTAIAESEAMAGALTVSAPETLCTYRLPGVLRRYRDIFPGVSVHVRSDSVAGLYRALNDGVTDLALIMAEPLQIPRCQVEELVEEPLLLLTYPEHPLARRATVGYADLQHEALLLTEAGCGYRIIFEQAAAAAGVRFSSPMEFHSVEAIKQCVIAGLGLTLLPAFAVAAELDQRRLVALPLEGAPLSISIQLVWHREKWISPALRTFLALVREELLPADVAVPAVG